MTEELIDKSIEALRSNPDGIIGMVEGMRLVITLIEQGATVEQIKHSITIMSEAVPTFAEVSPK